MSRYSRKIDRVTAERLLRGEPPDPRHPDDLLAVLLATAAAPAHIGELAGEETAVAAFRQARAADARAVWSIDEAAAAPRGPRENAPVRGWVRHPLRLALVALTATTAGGTALAAGSITWSQGSADRRPATASATPTRPAGGPGSSPGRHGSPASTPHASVTGLCRAYAAGTGSDPGKALENPAFRSLIEAAGGKDKVAGYCATVLAGDEAKPAKKAKRHGKAATPTTPPGQQGQSGQSGQQVLPDPGGRQGESDLPDLSGQEGQSGQARSTRSTASTGAIGSGETTADPSASATPADPSYEEVVPQPTRAS